MQKSLTLHPLWLAMLLALRASANEDVAIAFLTDCSMYSDWQTVAMAFSYKMTEQPGSIKRVMCCTDQERQRYNDQLLGLMPTHVAPSFAINPRTGDNYAAYNKPGAVVDWMARSYPEEHWVLVLDSDMLLRNKFHPNIYNTTRGWAASAPYTYLIGAANELWTRHIPHIPARNDTLAGPYGRHADQVGGFFFMHRDDMQKVAPLWLSTTEEVREDPEAWRLSGDQYVQKGGKPWISEMYGYVFGAAKAGVWHRWHKSTMLYPSYNPPGIPKVMHYGLLFSIDDYQFDKHWHFDFDVTKCPPWDSPFHQRSNAGIFEPPPWPKHLRSYQSKGRGGGGGYYRDLLSLETVTTLNAAFCDFHLRHCPPSQQLLDVCTMAVTQYTEVQREVQDEEIHYQCKDTEPMCQMWAKAGECDKNVGYMNENCRDACGLCAQQTLSETTPRPAPSETFQMLQKLASTLGVEMPVHSPDDPSVSMPGKRIADPNNGATMQQAAGQARRPDSSTPSTTTAPTAGVGVKSSGNAKVGAEGSGSGSSSINAKGGVATEQPEGNRVNQEALKAWQQGGFREDVGKGVAGNSGASSSGTGGAGAAPTGGKSQGMQQQQALRHSQERQQQQPQQQMQEQQQQQPRQQERQEQQHHQQPQTHVQPEDELSISKPNVVSPDEQTRREAQQTQEGKGSTGHGGPRVETGGGGEPGGGGQQLHPQRQQVQSPPQKQQQQEQQQQPQAAAPPSKSMRPLMLRCYRMSLTLVEVKACVDAARRLEQWEKAPGQATGDEAGSIEDTLDRQGTQGSTVSRSSRPGEKASRKLVLPSTGKAGSTAASSTNAEGRDSSILPKMITWQVCGVWILAVVAFLVAMPRFFRMRKRRSFRSE